MNSIELKIKSKSLAEEISIIRHEEQKLKRQIHWLKEHQQDASQQSHLRHMLNLHRRMDVRVESRATFLARAFLNGYRYDAVERARKAEKETEFVRDTVPKILKMVNKYGGDENRSLKIDNIKEWCNIKENPK